MEGLGPVELEPELELRSKLPSLSSVTTMFDFEARTSRRRDEARDDRDVVVIVSGICDGGDSDCGMEG